MSPSSVHRVTDVRTSRVTLARIRASRSGLRGIDASKRGTNAAGLGGSGAIEGLGNTVGVGDGLRLGVGVGAVGALSERGAGASVAHAAVRRNAVMTPATNLIRMTAYL